MPSNNDFWDEFLKSAYSGDEGLDFAGGYLTASEKEEAADLAHLREAVEHRMQGRSMNEGAFTSVRALTDREREKVSVHIPVEAGTRVQFAANVGAVLSYDDPPDPNASGVVVEVKSASGTITSHEGRVFVRWDDGQVRAIHAGHLRVASGRVRTTTAVTANRIRVASLGDLTEFMKYADDTLVHKATKDLWKVKKDGTEFVIERLFDDAGAPLKV